MIYTAVVGLSASSLAFEILITRHLSIAQWRNLAFLAVGIAKFGFAAGGTFHCMAEETMERAAQRTHGSKDCAAPGAAGRDGGWLFPLLSTCGSLAGIGAFLLVKAVPLDYMKLPVEGAQAACLLAVWRITALAAAAAWPVVSPDKGPLSVVPSPYKTQPQLVQASGTRVARTTFDIRGSLVEVEIPVLHDVPGPSLGFTGDFPR